MADGTFLVHFWPAAVGVSAGDLKEDGSCAYKGLFSGPESGKLRMN